MSAVMIELTVRQQGFEWVATDAPTVPEDAVVLVDDVETLGAFARCNCAASDDNPY
ncbi:MAG: hypothetical protein ABW215_06595 [Kibdelosporangium sp.]